MSTSVSFGGSANSYISAPCTTDPDVTPGVFLPSESGTGCLSFWFNMSSLVTHQGIGGGYAFNNFNILTIARGNMNAGTGTDEHCPKLYPLTFGVNSPHPIWATGTNTLPYLQVLFSRPGYNGVTAGDSNVYMGFYSCEDYNPYYQYGTDIYLAENEMPHPFVEKSWGEPIPCDDNWHHIMIVWDTMAGDDLNGPIIRAALDGTMMGDYKFRNGVKAGTALPSSGASDNFDCGWDNPTSSFSWNQKVYAPFVPFKMRFSTDNYSGKPFAAYVGENTLGLAEVYLNVWPKNANGGDVSYPAIAINNQDVMTAATDYFIADGFAATLNSPTGSFPFNIKRSDIQGTDIFTTGAPVGIISPPQIYLSGDHTDFLTNVPNFVTDDRSENNFSASFIVPNPTTATLYDWISYSLPPNSPFPSTDVNEGGPAFIGGNFGVGINGDFSNQVPAPIGTRVNSYTGWGTRNAVVTLSDGSVKTFTQLSSPNWFPDTLELTSAYSAFFMNDDGACVSGKRKLFDFSANTAKDMLVQTTAGQTIMWQFASGSWTYTTQNIGSTQPANMRIVAVGDFNGDGRGDIMWRNTITGEVIVWYLSNSTGTFTTTSFGTPLSMDWKVVGVADVNADSRSDVYWRNTVTGDNAIWQMSATAGTYTNSAQTNWATNYTFKGIGDFNGDSAPDTVWFDRNTSKVSIKTSAGTTVIPAPYGLSPWGGPIGDPRPEGAWFLEAIGDFDGNGRCDLLWRCVSGDFVISYFTGTSMAYTNIPYRMFTNNYQVVGIGDVTGDGKDDIVFRNTLTGEVVVAYGFSGTTSYSTHSLGTISLDTHF